MSKRTDCHRPGAIVPSDYEWLLSYALPEPEVPNSSFCMEEVRAMCEKINWGRSRCGVQMFGHVGRCGVCGAAYRYGDLWIHVPTGDYLHVGHDCADKYEMLADRPGFEAALDALKKGRAARIEAEKRKIQREDFLSRYPGLETALQCNHRIVRDINDRFLQWCSLSEKQVALVFKLAKEAAEPKPEKVSASVHVGAEKERLRDLRLTVNFIFESDMSRDGSMYDFGTQYSHIMSDAAGNVFVWRSSSHRLVKGAFYVLTGTVKKHGEYKGTKQTILTRCAYERIPEPAPVPAE